MAIPSTWPIPDIAIHALRTFKKKFQPFFAVNNSTGLFFSIRLCHLGVTLKIRGVQLTNTYRYVSAVRELNVSATIDVILVL